MTVVLTKNLAMETISLGILCSDMKTLGRRKNSDPNRPYNRI